MLNRFATIRDQSDQGLAKLFYVNVKFVNARW